MTMYRKNAATAGGPLAPILTVLLLGTTLILTSGYGKIADRGTSGANRETSPEPEVLASLGRMPVLFVANQGQVDGQVKYYTQAPGKTIYVTRDGVVFDLYRRSSAGSGSDGGTSGISEGDINRLSFTLEFIGADPGRTIVGMRPDEAVSNYFIGNDPAQWQRSVPSFREVWFKGVYPGTDLKLYGRGDTLAYDFIVDPGADVDNIKLSYNGIESLYLEHGELVVATAIGEVRQKPPYLYQVVGDRRIEIAGGFRLLDDRTYGFAVGDYDRVYPLFIDPDLVYSTYLGGSGSDYGAAIAVDTSGNVYVTGYTASTNFPTSGAYQGTYGGGGYDAFVAKLAANGSLSYSTYLGGSGDDYGRGIAVDSSGSAYVFGYTTSTNFPTAGAFQSTYGGGTNDAFVTKLAANGGSLIYSTYLGGSGDDYGGGIAVDSSGEAYVTGQTSSSNFPTSGAFQGANGDGFDAFVTRLAPNGGSLSYSTYLGGSSEDYGRGIAVDSSGNAYVVGYTLSTNFPTAGSYQTANAGSYDVFVSKLAANGGLSYSTYLGGGADDIGRGIATDVSGNVFVTGYTASSNFPVAGAYQGANGGGFDAFVVKLAANGGSLTYSTYLGGNGTDAGYSIAIDAAGSAYVTGQTSSGNFPLANAYQSAYGGGTNDVFVTKLAANGDSLNYSTYLGGSGDDYGYGIAVRSSGVAFLTGPTNSSNFPTVRAHQTTNGGSYDAFIARLVPDWKSFADSGHTTATDSFTSSANEHTVYMSGNGYAGNTTYRTIFWDAAGIRVAAMDTTTNSSGNLSAAHTFIQGNAVGAWHTAVYDSTSYSPTSYSGSDSHLAADDISNTGDTAFNVAATAIPEFPTMLAGIVPAGMCSALYWWLKRRGPAHVRA